MKAEEITWVKSPEFGVMDQIFLPAIFTGLVTTLTHMGSTLFGPKKYSANGRHLPKRLVSLDRYKQALK